MSVPVLLVIFNRPELTRRALEAIARVKPQTLLVAADGPRFPEEVSLCEQTRDLIRNIDWDCQVHTNFAETNLGCGIRVYTAIDWALSQFEELIILEDDCIPSMSFFRFCEELLAYYRDDQRVMHISGNNFQFGNNPAPYSYYFSKYFHVASFATWRRAWKHFDWRIDQWPIMKKNRLVESVCSDPYEQQYWTNIFDTVFKGRPDIWDYQWTFACWAQNGLSIIPSTNLVTNVGYGIDATHTKDLIPTLNLPYVEIQEIQHPPLVTRNYLADEFTFLNNYGGNALRQANKWQAKLRKKLRFISLPLRGIRKVWRLVNSQ